MTKSMRETTSMVAPGSASQEREAVKAAFQEVQSSFETFCLLAGIEAFQDLLEEEAADLCGERHQRHEDRRGRRWGRRRLRIGLSKGRGRSHQDRRSKKKSAHGGEARDGIFRRHPQFVLLPLWEKVGPKGSDEGSLRNLK